MVFSSGFRQVVIVGGPYNKVAQLGGIMDPEKIMNGISKEIFTALKAMGEVKTPEERRMYSETIKNLCDSLGVFLSLLSDMAPYGDEAEPIPF